ncbi:MAG: LysM domain-containing protein [Longimicrobiales bacterium]
MTDPSSRYHGIPEAELQGPDGAGGTRRVRYQRRRFLPAPEQLVTLVEHRVAQGDRLDNLSARYLGDPLAYWRIADANLELQPEALAEQAGRRIRIALPHI